jgi:hypothetical protein
VWNGIGNKQAVYTYWPGFNDLLWPPHPPEKAARTDLSEAITSQNWISADPLRRGAFSSMHRVWPTSSLAEKERRLIAERTKTALAAKKSAGARLGNPQSW